MPTKHALLPPCCKALSSAAESGNWRSLQLLLLMPEVRKFINVPNDLGMTPLHLACYARDAACIVVLVGAGALNIPTERRNGIAQQWPVDCVQHYIPKHPLRMEREELDTFQLLNELGFV
tara:strand:+ start:258 stop:617 length:360 start_codon:yes stop_codon:yes gene_type:complete